MRYVAVVILTALAASFISSAYHGRKIDDLSHALDTLASNEILRRTADSLGWEVQIAEARDDLREAVGDRDSLSLETQSLIETVEELEGRVAVATEVNVNLASALESEQAREHRTGEQVDSITADYDDGLLTGTIGYRPPINNFFLRYQATVRGSLVTSELPDGRVSIAARASDPRASLAIPRAFVSPPDPVRFCPLVEKGKWGLIGYLIGWAVPG